jgi:hypothetical protein
MDEQNGQCRLNSMANGILPLRHDRFAVIPIPAWVACEMSAATRPANILTTAGRSPVGESCAANLAIRPDPP